MITVFWQDGGVTTGDTWREAEDALRHAQWVPYKNRRSFRRDMRRRAKIWSGGRVPPGQTPRQFLESLEAAGLCRIEVIDTREVQL